MEVLAEISLDHGGVGADRVGTALCDLAAVVQHGDPVRDVHDEADHVLDEHDGHAALVPDAAHERVDLDDAVEAQPHRGLVEQEHARRADQRARDLDHPLLAERELGGQPVLERLHPHEGEDVAGEGGRQRLRRAQAAALEGGPEHALAETAVQARHHVLEDGHAAEELCRLKRAAEAAGSDRAGLEADERHAVETDLAAVGRVDAADDVQQRGLARAVGADDAKDLSFVQSQVDAVERDDAAEGDGDVPYHQAAHAGGSGARNGSSQPATRRLTREMRPSGRKMMHAISSRPKAISCAPLNARSASCSPMSSPAPSTEPHTEPRPPTTTMLNCTTIWKRSKPSGATKLRMAE